MAGLPASAQQLTFDDEFSSFVSSPYGTKGWMTTFPFAGDSTRTLPPNHEVENYQDQFSAADPFSLADGLLTITARPDPASSSGGWTSGQINTYKSFSQLYGYFEVRAKLPAGAGLWPAFWLLSADDANTAELDVFEQLGSDPSTTYSTVHGTTGGADASLLQVVRGPDSSAGFHTYGMDWEPDRTSFYLDGALVASTATPGSASKPMYVLLNLAVGGTGSWPGPADATTPTAPAMQIDYVRAYATANTRDVSGTAAIASRVAPPAVETLGTGLDRLVLGVSEDAFQGDAMFTVAVDGRTVGGTLMATARHDMGQSQAIVLQGAFGSGPHTVGITFLNPADGGTPALRRTLYVDRLEDAGIVSAVGTSLGTTEPAEFRTQVVPVEIGGGPDMLVVEMSEDAYLGDAQFTLTVDGVQVGGTQTTMALHAGGQTQAFTIQGSYAAGPHRLTVTFINDAVGADPAGDRNLYVGDVSFNGVVTGGHASLFSNGTADFSFGASATAQADAGSTLFDRAWYLRSNPDVAASGMDPLLHYQTYGWREGRNPTELFDTRYYLANNADVAARGEDPLAHFETYGWTEGRAPSALFDTRFYLQAYPDVAAAGLDPLAHYEEWGRAEGRLANPLFDAAYYLRENPDVAVAGLDPLAHYDQFGWHENRDPSPLFDTAYYVANNPAVVATGSDPLAHYEREGWAEERNPDPLFDVAYYLRQNPDVAAAGVDPLVHYDTFGWREGRNPSASFDNGAYLAANPGVNTDPLKDYLATGQFAGRAIFAVT